MVTITTPIALFSAKDGIGKTFFAANLAKVIALRKIKVLLVDVDENFAGLTQWLIPNAASNNEISERNFLSWLSNKENYLEEVINQGHSFTKSIPNFLNVANYLAILPHHPTQKNISQNIISLFSQMIDFLLKAKQSNYAYIIFDCGAGYTPLNLVIATIANSLIFLQDADFVSKTATQQMKFWIEKHKIGLIQIIEQIYGQNVQNWQFIKEWYRSSHLENKQQFLITSRSILSENALGKRWELPSENKIIKAYEKRETLVLDDFVSETGFNLEHIETVYLFQLLKIYQSIAFRYEESIADFDILDRHQQNIEKKIAQKNELEIQSKIEEKNVEISCLQNSIHAQELQIQAMEAALLSIPCKKDKILPMGCQEELQKIQQELLMVLQQSIPQIQQDIQQNGEAIHTIRLQQQSNQQLQESVNFLNNQIELLVQDNQIKQKQLEQDAKKLATLSEELEKSQTQANSIFKEFQENNNQCQVLQKKYQEITNQTQNFQQQNQDLQKQLELLKQESTTIIQQKQDLQKKLESTQKDIKTISEQKQELQQRLNESTHELQQTINRLTQQNQEITQRYNQVSQENRQLSTQKENIIVENRELKSKSQNLETQVRELQENSSQEASKTQYKYQKLSTNFQQLENDYTQLQVANQQLQASNQQLQASNQQLQISNQQLQNENHQLIADRQNLIQKYQILEKNYTTFANQNGLENIHKQISALTQERDSLAQNYKKIYEEYQRKLNSFRELENAHKQLSEDMNNWYNKLKEISERYKTYPNIRTAFMEFESSLKRT